jgi:hypothetical protein
MTAKLRVELTGSPTSDEIHRFRNLGEEIYGALKGTCSIDLSEIDEATKSFTVADVRHSDLGAVKKSIEKTLKKHNFTDSAKLVRV